MFPSIFKKKIIISSKVKPIEVIEFKVSEKASKILGIHDTDKPILIKNPMIPPIHLPFTSNI